MGNVSLVIIDPVTAFLGKSDVNNSGEVRRITTELTALAQTYGVCVLMLTHLNKNSDKAAVYRMLGSVAWVGAARTAFAVERDSRDSERRIMAPVKNNLASDTTAFAYTVQSAEVEVDGGIQKPFVVWEDASHTSTADEVFGESNGDGYAIKEAREFILASLQDGPCPSNRIIEEVTRGRDQHCHPE